MIITGGFVSYQNGDKLPIDTSYSWSDSKNGLKSFITDTTSVIPNVGVIKIQNVNKLKINYK